MLQLLQSPADVLTLLYTLGNGVGLPRKTLEHLAPFIRFIPNDEPSGYEECRIVNESTGEVLANTRTPRFAPKMAYLSSSDNYLPTLDDIEIKFALPAVSFLHFEDSADRLGNYTVAFFDIQAVSDLQVPVRFSVRSRLVDLCNLMSARDFALTPEAYTQKTDWLNGASELEVRQGLSRQFEQDFLSDQGLVPYLSNYGKEFSLFYVFLKGGDWNDVQAAEQRRLDRQSPQGAAR